MANKTIYVADEKLWKEAKKLAGAKGLSAVITDALRRYISERRFQDEGYQDWRFAAGPGGADRIAFNGKELVQFTLKIWEPGKVWPEEAFQQQDDFVTGKITVFLTRKGTFVVVADLINQQGDEVPMYWRAHQGMSSLKDDEAILTLNAVERAELLDQVNVADEDWATRID